MIDADPMNDPNEINPTTATPTTAHRPPPEMNPTCSAG